MTAEFTRLHEIVARLRGPDGCPWDKEQTSASLVPSLIEEVYEVIDAIQRNDLPHLREELGDLLLHVVFQAQVASDTNDFTMEEVMHELCEKLIRRHPHVFGESSAKDTASVLKQWEEIKRAEKGGALKKQSQLDGVPDSFPALLRAAKLQQKAAQVGFDWPDTAPVFEKIAEEIAEVREAIEGNDNVRVEDEVGDLLFSVVNLARKLNIAPELALQRASNKFRERFMEIEKLAAEKKLRLENLSLTELDALWDQAKLPAPKN